MSGGIQEVKDRSRYYTAKINTGGTYDDSSDHLDNLNAAQYANNGALVATIGGQDYTFTPEIYKGPTGVEHVQYVTQINIDGKDYTVKLLANKNTIDTIYDTFNSPNGRPTVKTGSGAAANNNYAIEDNVIYVASWNENGTQPVVLGKIEGQTSTNSSVDQTKEWFGTAHNE